MDPSELFCHAEEEHEEPQNNVIRVSRPTFEHHFSGLGLSTPTPRISWMTLPSPPLTNGFLQRGYQIEVAVEGQGGTNSSSNATNDPAPAAVVDQSCKLSSDSLLVPWPARPLRSRERARARVRVVGNGIHRRHRWLPLVSCWSEWATVECSLLNSEDWHAVPITAAAGGKATKGPPRPLLFRKVFSLPPYPSYLSSSPSLVRVRRARLYVTAFGVYTAFINGANVSVTHEGEGEQCMAPGWQSYQFRHSYQVFDVGNLLRDGDNVIAFEVAEGWYSGRLGPANGVRNFYGNKLAVLAQLEVFLDWPSAAVRMAPPSKMTLITDRTWKVHPSPILSAGIYDGEVYDARLEAQTRGWNSDCSGHLFSDNAWTYATELPLPSVGGTRLVAPDAPPVRVTQEVLPQHVFRCDSGHTIIDFGQNLVGKLRVRGITGPPGATVSFYHAEVMEHGRLGRRPLRSAKACDRIILGGGGDGDDEDTEMVTVDEWTPRYTFHGFRYVQIDGWESLPLTLADAKEHLVALVVHTDLERTGWFECSDKMVNRLHENAVWSMRGNFLSIPTDCPQRDERLGWTGDINVFVSSAEFLFNATGMLSGWLEDLAAEQERRNGVVPVVIPNVLEYFMPVRPVALWGDACILVPYHLHQYSGDAAILSRQYASMKSWLVRGIRRGEDGLWHPGNAQYGDWLDPSAPPGDPSHGKTNPMFVADAYLLKVTDVVVRTARLLDQTQDAKIFENQRDKLAESFQKKYFTSSGTLKVDSQTSHALLISLIHLPSVNINDHGHRLATLVRQRAHKVSTGFAGTPLILHALSQTNNSATAYKMLLQTECPGWLYPITMGATTIWERWDSMLPDGRINPGSMTSFNHYALGSVVDWLHGVVGGLVPREAGWKTFFVRPVVPGPGVEGAIHAARAEFMSPYGMIRCKWRVVRRGEGRKTHDGITTCRHSSTLALADVFEAEFEVPPNTTAFVTFPGSWSKGQEVGAGTHTYRDHFHDHVSGPVTT